MPEKTLPVTTNIPLCDCVSHMEGMVLLFVAKYSFPFSSAQNIVELCKEIIHDPKTVNKLQVARTAASYKMRNGLARGLGKQLVDKLKKGFFSFNIDEATSATLHKVLTLLESYFCSTKNEVAVEHLGSLNLPTVNSETVFKAVVNLMDEKNLPFSNLMAVLMDSCSVMRGSKSGFEVKLRENVASDLTDIDGDACHCIHNASKKFTEIVNKHLEILFWDIYNDFKWLEDLRVILEEMCECLDISYRRPEMFVSTRWLTVYDISISTIYMFDVYVVLYFSFLNKQDKKLYQSRFNGIYSRHEISEESKARIEASQNVLSKKRLTKEGKERKERVLEKIFLQKRKPVYIQVFIPHPFK